jgi:hypothetical protein
MNTINIIESGIARYISALEDLCFSWGWKPVRRSGHRSGFYWVPPLPAVRSDMCLLMDNKKPVRIYRVRQVTEAAIALAFTFGLMFALRKPGPAPDQAKLVAELREELERHLDRR